MRIAPATLARPSLGRAAFFGIRPPVCSLYDLQEMCESAHTGTRHAPRLLQLQPAFQTFAVFARWSVRSG